MKRSSLLVPCLLTIALLAMVILPACNSTPPVLPGGQVTNFKPSNCNGVFGDSNIEGSSAVNSGDIYANKYSFSGGTIQSISLYTSGAGQISAAIYADNGSGAPTTLIAQSAAVSTTASAGWSVVPLPLNLPAGNYWLTFQTDTNVSTYYNNTGSTPMPYIPQVFGPFPSSYTGYTTCAYSVFSMIANYCK